MKLARRGAKERTSVVWANVCFFSLPHHRRVTPLLATKEAPAKFQWSRWVPRRWLLQWTSNRIRSLASTHRWEAPLEAGLLGDTGWVVLPSDPTRAVGFEADVHRLRQAIPGKFGVVGSAVARSWFDLPPDCPWLDLPPDGENLVRWCREHLQDRRTWAWCWDGHPDPRVVAAFRWLGAVRRIGRYSRPDLPPDLSNLALVPGNGTQDEGPDSLETFLRILGMETSPVAEEVRKGGRGILLHLSSELSRPPKQPQLDLLDAVSRCGSLVALHTGPMGPEWMDALRLRQSKVSVVHLTDIGRLDQLATDSKVWVGEPDPAAVRAARKGCSLVLSGSRSDFETHAWLERRPSNVAWIPSLESNPTATAQAVLDFLSHGM